MTKFDATKDRPVFVGGVSKGVVYKRNGRWMWRRSTDGIATDSWPRRSVLDDVRSWIAKTCNADLSLVIIKRTESP